MSVTNEFQSLLSWIKLGNYGKPLHEVIAEWFQSLLSWIKLGNIWHVPASVLLPSVFQSLLSWIKLGNPVCR